MLLPLTPLICAAGGYALWKGGPALRLAAALVLFGLVIYHSNNPKFALLLCAACGYALWKGGQPERLTAAALVIGVVFTDYVDSPVGPVRWTSLETGVLLVDVAVLIAWGAIALRAERFWPIWFTAMHAIAVAGHAIKILDPDFIRLGYAFAIAFWSYPMLLILAGATWCHRRRLARYGADPDWSEPRGQGGSWSGSPA
jgi:hypothetical protein